MVPHNGDILQNNSQPGYWHWYSQDTEHFHHYHKYPSCRLVIATPTSFPSPSPPLPLEQLVSSLFLQFQECYVNGKILYVTFWDWLFSVHIIFGDHLGAVAYPSSLFLLSRILWCGCTVCLTIYPLKDIYIAASFWLLQMKFAINLQV